MEIGVFLLKQCIVLDRSLVFRYTPRVDHSQKITSTRLKALPLIEELLVAAGRERQHGRVEVVIRDGVVDHLRVEQVVKISTPPKAA